jgi:hypothetical protein
VDAVGRAANFPKWPRSETLHAAPSSDVLLPLKPATATKESAYYSLVEFQGQPWGRCELVWRQQAEGAVSGEMNVRVCLAPNGQAAQEYLLSTMTESAMPTEALAKVYSSPPQLPDLGTVSFVTESRQADDRRIMFVRDNICVSIRAGKNMAQEAVPLARQIDRLIARQPALTEQQLVGRRPVVGVVGEPKGPEGAKSISYEVSAPQGQKVVSVWSPSDGQNAANKDGTISLAGKKGAVALRVTAITSELLAGTTERQVVVPEP